MRSRSIGPRLASLVGIGALFVGGGALRPATAAPMLYALGGSIALFPTTADPSILQVVDPAVGVHLKTFPISRIAQLGTIGIAWSGDRLALLESGLDPIGSQFFTRLRVLTPETGETFASVDVPGAIFPQYFRARSGFAAVLGSPFQSSDPSPPPAALSVVNFATGQVATTSDPILSPSYAFTLPAECDRTCGDAPPCLCHEILDFAIRSDGSVALAILRRSGRVDVGGRVQLVQLDPERSTTTNAVELCSSTENVPVVRLSSSGSRAVCVLSETQFDRGVPVDPMTRMAIVDDDSGRIEFSLERAFISQVALSGDGDTLFGIGTGSSFPGGAFLAIDVRPEVKARLAVRLPLPDGSGADGLVPPILAGPTGAYALLGEAQTIRSILSPPSLYDIPAPATYRFVNVGSGTISAPRVLPAGLTSITPGAVLQEGCNDPARCGCTSTDECQDTDPCTRQTCTAGTCSPETLQCLESLECRVASEAPPVEGPFCDRSRRRAERLERHTVDKVRALRAGPGLDRTQYVRGVRRVRALLHRSVAAEVRLFLARRCGDSLRLVRFADALTQLRRLRPELEQCRQDGK